VTSGLSTSIRRTVSWSWSSSFCEREGAPHHQRTSNTMRKPAMKQTDRGHVQVGFGDWGWRARTFIWDIMSYTSERDMALIWAARASPAAACFVAMAGGSTGAGGPTRRRWRSGTEELRLMRCELPRGKRKHHLHQGRPVVI
jgi:hypothetical protein